MLRSTSFGLNFGKQGRRINSFEISFGKLVVKSTTLRDPQARSRRELARQSGPETKP